MTISVDAMGGDNAPRMVVEGVNLNLTRHPGVRFLLFGRERQLRPLFDEYPDVRSVAEIRDTIEVVGSGEKPSVALRTGRNSSMRKAIDAVGSGEAAAIVSAGNTGALMAMAKFVMKTLPGVDRPAIATVFPTLRGRTVVLDLGANVECDENNLVQFAVMGEVFSRKVLGLERPTVAILNIGEEDLKGNLAVKKAATILQESNLSFHFYGFVEGNDIGAGTVDVVVTDGFTGNVALKTIEGTSKLFSHYLKTALTSSALARLGAILAGPALRNMKTNMDPRRHDGAMFLGLNGVCVKSHGGTDALGFSNAIHVAVELVRDRVNEGIKEDFASLKAGFSVNSKVATG